MNKFLFLLLLLNCFLLIVCQLPLQVKPKVRGFPKKNNGGIEGRGVIEPMYRLNNTFMPSHYDVQIRVILDSEEDVGEQFTAPGKSRILGKTGEKLERLVLHANRLEINESSVSVTRGGNPIPITGFKEDTLRHFFIIELAQEVNATEELAISIEHNTTFSQIEEGLFYRTYKTDKGETRRVAATQFESVYARRLFPCFDEPGLKATFQLTVIHKDNYIALSNTERISSTLDPNYPGWIADTFAPTVRMSTYTVAFSVTDFTFSEAFFGTKSARTYAPKHLIDVGAGDFAAQAGAKCLSFYEQFYNESYKLEKMDMIAIEDFGGAMENWGMNVYGTEYLMFLPREQSEADRNQVTMILAHELAHQWFGNLVTMVWWNHLYLSEGLTTYSQYLGVDAAHPEFRGDEWVILDAVQYSMRYDAGLNTHPLSWNVTTPDEIEGMFSTITYEKGASVFRMMEGFLTRPTLQKGLQRYLTTLSFTAAEQDDLFDVLQQVALEDKRLPEDLTMQKIMHTWADQSGFPLVKMGVVNATHINISQERFRNDGYPELEGSWYVPVAIATEKKPRLENFVPEVWLEAGGESKMIEHNSEEWIMINPNGTGFYRVLYDAKLVQLIQKQLEKDASLITPLSRSQLLDDYFTFYRQNQTNIQVALNLTRYLHQETHFTVWSTFFEHFSRVYEKFGSHSAYPLIQKYLQPKVDAALVAVGVEEDPKRHVGAEAILRADLLDWACALGTPLCKEYAMKLLAVWQANPGVNPITSVDARATLQCAIVAAGGKVGFDFIFAKYQEANEGENAHEDAREEYLSALACATDVSIIGAFLNKTLQKKSGLNPTDLTLIIVKIAMNPAGRPLMIPFLTDNFDQVEEIIGNGTVRPVAAVLNELATYYSTQAHLDQINKFVETFMEKLTSVAGLIRAAQATVRNNIKWMDTTGLDVWMWLWFQSKK